MTQHSVLETSINKKIVLQVIVATPFLVIEKKVIWQKVMGLQLSPECIPTTTHPRHAATWEESISLVTLNKTKSHLDNCCHFRFSSPQLLDK